MSDKFYRISITRLYKWILNEEKEGKIFGIYKDNFFVPRSDDPFRMERYGEILETPLGVAAGPHTQMAHNIIAAWLTGSRYIELKTVQTLDELEVTKPCIDMEDEGYNCEWSQELKIKDSFDEYLNAWILIHLLKHKFNWEDNQLGLIFNMSVGYNLEGILKPNVQWFFDKMSNCTLELEEKITELEKLYPEIRAIKIPTQISNNITLSTMHGCPANEIEAIGKYLIEKRRLHTTIKLNPTLLGKTELRYILNEKLGYKIEVPDEAFEHDLKYNDAIQIITSLQKSADETGVQFSLKLTNTLEATNTTNWLPENETMVYTSGRALHPISINLLEKLQNSFNGKLDISFSAGIDAFNITETLSCNVKPITVCSDLLKPGGYLRMTQYVDEIKEKFLKVDAKSINDFIKIKGTNSKIVEAGLVNLHKYANSVLENVAYHKEHFLHENIKTNRELTKYDCVKAPCTESCAVSQDVSEYMWHTGNGNFGDALRVILKDNPLPNITGNVCDHLCETKCTRMNYDSSLLIRGIKRFNSENANINAVKAIKNKNGLNVAIIGAGPSGLSSAYFLALEGFNVNLYESKSFAGGMASDSIPFFRLTDGQIKKDVDLIKSLGVKFHFNKTIDYGLFNELRYKNDFVHVAVGAQKSKSLNIKGEDNVGVINQLLFLSKIRRKEKINIGKSVAVIGGGNSAIDAARTAKRLVGVDGSVTVVYRRTKDEMPADKEEVSALLSEGIELLELTSPKSISRKNGLLNFNLSKMALGKLDSSGRPRPIEIPNSHFSLSFDTIIPAIGQEVNLDFIEENNLSINEKTFETQLPNVFAGGDAIRGADSLINAIGDGKKIAEQIIKRAIGISNRPKTKSTKFSLAEFQHKQATRVFGKAMPEIKLSERDNFALVHPSLSAEEAKEEANRCLQCDDVCNICVGVCPNFANVSFQTKNMKVPIYVFEQHENEYQYSIEDYFVTEQEPQIFNIGDFCNECGNCNTFCPTNDAPYLTKPKFYLTSNSFGSEDNCYLFENNVLHFKLNGKTEKLIMNNGQYIYNSKSINVILNAKDYSILEFEINKSHSDKIVLAKLSEMIFLFDNLINNAVLIN